MEADNNNNPDSGLDDPTVELESLYAAACSPQAEVAPAQPEAVTETAEAHLTCLRTSAGCADDIASEIRRLRDELSCRSDMNSILRHRNDRLREKCCKLEAQVAELLENRETRRQESAHGLQPDDPGSTDAGPDTDAKSALSVKRGSNGAGQIASTRSPAGVGEAHVRLVLLDENGADIDAWSLADEISTIGSGADCDIRIHSKFVSRHHARLVKRQGGLVLEDLDSTNGTYVNARRINKRAVRPGDRVTIGKLRLEYRAQSEQSASAGSSRLGHGLP